MSLSRFPSGTFSQKIFQKSNDHMALLDTEVAPHIFVYRQCNMLGLKYSGVSQCNYICQYYHILTVELFFRKKNIIIKSKS